MNVIKGYIFIWRRISKPCGEAVMLLFIQPRIFISGLIQLDYYQIASSGKEMDLVLRHKM